MRFATYIDPELGFTGGTTPLLRPPYQVLCRGYIANRRDIASATGCNESQDDAGLFAAAYARWGARLQQHVLGEYCVAVFDEVHKRAVLTHDAVGLRPLYHTRGGPVAFGSHLADLAALTGRSEIDDEFAAHFLLFGLGRGAATVYRSLCRLGAGRTLEWSRRGLKETVTWSLRALDRASRPSAASAYEEEFRALLVEAVSSTMSGRTWAELSGGLDSSSIVCAASRAGAQDLEAVSIVYSRSRTANEEYWMREVISHTGVGWRTIDGDETTPFSMLPDQMLDCPTTTAVNWRLFKTYQSLLRENAVHTLLSGYGGDQTLYGECNRPLDLADLLRSARIRAALSDIDRWSAVGTTRPKTHTLFYDGAVPLYRYLRGFRISSAPSQAVTAPWLREEFVRSMPLLRRPARAAKPRMHSVASQRFWESTDHVALVAPQMWNQVYDGFELRFPLLSRPLIEYMFQLPADLTAVPEGDRVLQRSALRGLLPEAVRVRTTKGGPDEAFFAGLRRNPEMVELLTDDPLVVQRGYVSSTAWREAVRAARYGRITWTRPFIATASLEMWLHQRAASPPGQPRVTAPVGIE